MLKPQKLHVCSTDEQSGFQHAHKCLKDSVTLDEKRRKEAVNKRKPRLNRGDSKSKFGTDREILRTGTFCPNQFTKKYIPSHMNRTCSIISSLQTHMKSYSTPFIHTYFKTSTGRKLMCGGYPTSTLMFTTLSQADGL